MKHLRKYIDKCRKADSSIVLVAAFYLFNRLRGKNIMVGSKVKIFGKQNIFTNGLLQIGLFPNGFMGPHDATFVRVAGKLFFSKPFSIAKGCRISVAAGASAHFGSGYVNAETVFVIESELRVGDGCAISWGCQFVDDDFHVLEYEGKVEKKQGITIGDNVWIGSKASFFRGVNIPDGCVVAAGSVVTSSFSAKNSLIAGNPARVIRENISWH